jgi:hypothetical protein
MRSKILTSMILFACLFLIGGFPSLCGAEDYAAKKGVALHRADLQNLVQQIVKLDPKEKDQRDFLDRLFQMKLAEAERMFQVCGDAQEVKRQVAEIYLLKAIEADAMGSWIQAYFALQSSEAWNKEALTQYLQIGEKGYKVAAFAKELEKKLQRWGNNVRFVIKPFPREKMFQPDRVVLARSEEEQKEKKTAVNQKPSQGRPDRDSPGGRWDAIEGSPKKMEISPKDKAYLLDRFNKALYAFYYNPIERNAEFDLFLPYGEYHLYEKDFTVHPVEFAVSGRSTQVVLRPARWFRLAISEEVHPANVRLSFHGTEWKDLNHVPFGSYRVRVQSNEYTAPAARMTFVPKGDGISEEEAAASRGEVVVVEDRGVYKMTLRERTGNEKLRHSLLGF